MIIRFDTTQNASVEVRNQVTDIVRTGTVEDVEGKVDADSSILLRAIQQRLFAQAASGYPNAGQGFTVLSRLVVSPIGGTNNFRWSATYVRPTAGLMTSDSTTAWLVRTSTAMAMETEMIDRNGLPIQTVYKPGKDNLDLPSDLSGINKSGPEYGVHTAEIPVERPRLSVRISGYLFALPDQDIRLCLNRVNDRKWSGLPTGFWRCTALNAEPENAYPQSGNKKRYLYRVDASFLSKLDRDWSSYAIHRDLNGRIPLDMCTKKKSETIRLMVYGKPRGSGPADFSAFPYTTKQNRNAVAGFVKVGLYDIANFQDAFNFDLTDYR